MIHRRRWIYVTGAKAVIGSPMELTRSESFPAIPHGTPRHLSAPNGVEEFINRRWFGQDFVEPRLPHLATRVVVIVCGVRDQPKGVTIALP